MLEVLLLNDVEVQTWKARKIWEEHRIKKWTNGKRMTAKIIRSIAETVDPYQGVKKDTVI